MYADVDINYGDELRITRETTYLLNSIAKWTKFLSVLAFVLLGLMVLGILWAGMMSGSANYYEMNPGMLGYGSGIFSWAYAILYVLVLCVYAIPFYFLYKFSVKVKKAIQTNNVAILTDSFRFLQKHYLFIGIITIIWLIFMVIGCIMMIPGMANGF